MSVGNDCAQRDGPAGSSASNHEILAAWFRRLVAAWRAARSTAHGETIPWADTSVFSLWSPVQITAYVIEPDDTTLLAATAAVITHDSTRPDATAELLCISNPDLIPTETKDDAHRLALERLRQHWAAIATNWSPERQEGTRVRLPSASMVLSAPPGTVVWATPGRLWELPVDAVIVHAFRKPATVEPVMRTRSKPLVFESAERRERRATLRWLDGHAHELVSALGLRGGFWCGLFLPRDVVFGEPGLEGDVDIIAGPMTYRMTELEFAQHWEWMAAQVDLATPASMVDSFALMKAAEDGLVEWPPRVEPLVSCEVKASWYDVEQGSWKATHENEGRRISGQLRQLLDRGVDRCAYLHLGFTQARAPHPDWVGIDPWLRAGSDIARAGLDFPEVTLGPEVAMSGHFTAVVGAVHHATENLSGATGALAIVREALDNPRRASADASWRGDDAHLLSLLRRFPTPRAVPAFIVYCKDCDRYGLAGSPSRAAFAACPCGSNDA